MADAVEAALRLCPWLAVERVGDNVVARTDLGRDVRVLLGRPSRHGPAGRAATRSLALEDDVLYGVGAADMKGGLAVFLHLAGCLPEPAVDVTWCFYACEEVEQEFNGLRQLWEQRPDLLGADAAILGEPTGGMVEAGCQGTLRVRVTLARGAGPHRPPGHRPECHPPAGPGAGRRRRLPEPRARCSTAASTSSSSRSVEISGGVAANVVPDEASVLVNHRFAPDRPVAEAEASVRDLLGASPRAGRPVGAGRARPRRPAGLDHPVLARSGRRPPATRPRPSRAGPTWLPSGRTGSRRPTSAPAIRCWPTPRASMSAGTSSSGRRRCCTPCCARAGSDRPGPPRLIRAGAGR